MTLGPDLVDVLVDDHRELERLLTAAATEDREQPGVLDRHPRLVDRDRLLALAIAEVARHIVVEEEHLYPLVRETAPNGPDLADWALIEDRDAELVLKDLEQAAPLGRIDALLKTLEESGALERDRQAFEAARADYLRTRSRLAELNNELGEAQRQSVRLGPQIAALIGMASGLVSIAAMTLMGIGF